MINTYTKKKWNKKTYFISDKESSTWDDLTKITFEWDLFFSNVKQKVKTIMNNTNNLFGTDWMEHFDLNSFYKKVEGFSNETEKLKKN